MDQSRLDLCEFAGVPGNASDLDILKALRRTGTYEGAFFRERRCLAKALGIDPVTANGFLLWKEATHLRDEAQVLRRLRVHLGLSEDAGEDVLRERLAALGAS